MRSVWVFLFTNLQNEKNYSEKLKFNTINWHLSFIKPTHGMYLELKEHTDFEHYYLIPFFVLYCVKCISAHFYGGTRKCRCNINK